MLKPISSRDNPLIKQLRRLAESSRARREEGLAVIDGVHLIDSALTAAWPLETVLVSDSACALAEVRALLDRVGGASCYQVPDALFRLVSPVETPVGVLATVRWRDASAAPDPSADWLVLDGVQDAGNVGSMLRTAAAAGVCHVILGPGCAHAWGPKVLRAGMGAHFVVRLHECERLPELLQGYRGQVIATRLDAATSLFDADLRAPCAWLFGAEGTGLSQALAALAEHGVLIPMAPGIESLNVGAAAAICLFEQRRQRIAAAE